MIVNTDNIKNRTVTGLFWSLGEQFGHHGISVLITLTLARFLTPNDYGLIGLTTVFFSIATTIVESGFRKALIRKKTLTNTDRSTVFYTNLVVSCIIYVMLFFFSPLIASFFKEPRLINLIRFIGIKIIIYAFQIVQISDLTRKMDFKTQVKITLPSGILSGLLAIILAWKGFGVWSLAIQMVLTGFLTTLLYWIHNRWLPTRGFNWETLKELFAFSSKLLVSSLLATIFDNLYTFVIGAFFSTRQLGFYSFAMKIKRISSEQITSALQRVTFPALSIIQDEKEKLKTGYRKIIQCSVYTIFPAMVILFIMAEMLIKILFGTKWLPAVPYIQILCIVGAMYPLNAINLNLLNVKGRSDLFLKLEIIKKVLIIAMMFVTIPFGIWHLLIGQAILSIAAYFLNSYYTASLIGYSIYKQIKDILPSLILALVMGIIIYFFNKLLHLPIILNILFLPVIAIFIYLVLSNLFKVEAFFHLQSLLYEIFNKKKNYKKKIKSTNFVSSNNGINT